MPAGPPADPADTAQRIKAEAFALGFDLVGITTLGPVDGVEHFLTWLNHGFAGSMDYLARGAEKRADTTRVFDGAVSAIVVGMNYGGTQPAGPIARYARGRDYHDVLVDRLNDLLSRIRQLAPDVRGKPYVDTGPILERELARRAGLGWFGKNTNLINPRLGSFFFIGSLLVDLDLPPDPPFEAEHCGSCRRCVEACPTDAFVQPHMLNATRCISYLTIELRGDVDPALRPLIGELVFGCDICQDVCPWNVKFSRDVADGDLAPRGALTRPDLPELLALSDERFRARFGGTAVTRTKRKGLARNVAVALGNRGAPGDREALRRALSDADPVVRSHARDALARLDAYGTTAR
jgi:epoxyqueuosine reductase